MLYGLMAPVYATVHPAVPATTAKRARVPTPTRVLPSLLPGILSKEMFAAAAIMCLATTFVVPMLLKWLAGVFPREMEETPSESQGPICPPQEMEEIHSGVEEPVWAYQEIIRGL